MLKIAMICNILLAATCSLSLFNPNKPVNSGHHIYGKETVGAIRSNGFTVLNGTQVKGTVQVNGSLNAENAFINSLYVNGAVDLKYSRVNEKVFINGPLNAQHSHFNKGLSICCESVTLSTCNAESLVIRRVEGYKGLQNIHLSNGTKIKDALIVESGQGQIWLSDDSTIPIRVHGATVIKAKPSVERDEPPL